MEPDSCSMVPICESCLDKWEVIGSGGFGQIFKARHVHWAWDVAIKILHHDNGSSSALLREADLMRRGESPFVVRVSGVFKGRLPSSGHLVHLGLVMDYMEQGSLADLQATLCGPPPWPLAFRLAYQVALGMNFLHTLSPPLLHLDLKPSNVLLDSSLNAKLADFGLARCYHSVSRRSKQVGSVEEGGTTSYMPPESFSMDYKPTCSSDMYSYGILLWSILTGQKPYNNAFSSLVRLRIPVGDRPTLEKIDQSQAAGLGPLVEMMTRCWASVPQERPSFLECITVTEKQYDIHKTGINNAVHTMHTLLEAKKQNAKMISEGLTNLHITQPSAFETVPDLTGLTGPPPVQETAAGPTTKPQVPDRDTDEPSTQPMSFFKTESSGPSTNTEEVSTPNHTLGSDTEHVRPTMYSNGAEKSQKANFRQAGPYQRQISSPEAFNHQPGPVNINSSHISGFQYGSNNYMYVCNEVSAERRRHPTAPSTFNTRPPNSGSHTGQTGKLG
ncbi:hypothetical protein NHX12_013712 [Muraenolepis orangiensis]|uniref:Protein kinase domain-containing protein n=1 Tax=Muraenolepis orangiensis TaxID=630683 RepID=A0A9Q0D9Z7_9TELE|nr:hypothetical protein NHX12_013712 [Muraenolepis orangiensis]